MRVALSPPGVIGTPSEPFVACIEITHCTVLFKARRRSIDPGM
jgi:hypothetical protein